MVYGGNAKACGGMERLAYLLHALMLAFCNFAAPCLLPMLFCTCSALNSHTPLASCPSRPLQFSTPTQATFDTSEDGDWTTVHLLSSPLFPPSVFPPSSPPPYHTLLLPLSTPLLPHTPLTPLPSLPRPRLTPQRMATGPPSTCPGTTLFPSRWHRAISPGSPSR